MGSTYWKLHYQNFSNLGDGSENLTLMPALVVYDNMTTENGPIKIKDLPFSFDVTLKSQQTLIKFDKLDDANHSYTGIPCQNRFK